MTSRQKEISLSKKILFTLLILASLFSILEISFSYLKKFKKAPILSGEPLKSPYSFSSKLHALQYQINKYSTHNILSFFGYTRINNIKSSDEFRIFILGGSTAAGDSQSSFEKSYFKILEAFLNKNKPESLENFYFSITNQAYGGKVSTDELMFFLFDTLSWQPDIVIVFDGGNDFVLPIPTETGANILPGEPLGYRTFKHRIKTIEKRPFVVILNHLVSKSAFLTQVQKWAHSDHLKEPIYNPYIDLQRVIKTQRKQIPPDKKYLQNIIVKNIAKHYARNLKIIAQVSNANRILPIFITQPLLWEKRFITPEESSRISKRAYNLKPFILKYYRVMEKVASTVAKNHDALFLSGKKIIENEKRTMFHDFIHFDNQGAEILAKKIFDSVGNDIYRFAANKIQTNTETKDILDEIIFGHKLCGKWKYQTQNKDILLVSITQSGLISLRNQYGVKHSGTIQFEISEENYSISITESSGQLNSLPSNVPYELTLTVNQFSKEKIKGNIKHKGEMPFSFQKVDSGLCK